MGSRRLTRLVYVGLPLALIAWGVLGGKNTIQADTTTAPERVANTPGAAPVVAAPAPQRPAVDPAKITTAIKGVVADHSELSIGVSFYDLKGKQWVQVNGNQPFIAASTTKVLVACTLLSQVEAGKHSLDDDMGAYTVGWQLQQMVNQSNNDSWALLTDYIGYGAINSYATSHGLTTYNYQVNAISPHDQASLLAQLYQGQLLNPDDTKLLLSYMQNTNMDDLIPAALGQKTQVYHKYGALDDKLHDAAIVDDGSQPFVLAVYTSDENWVDDYDTRVSVFHEIVQAVEQALN